RLFGKMNCSKHNVYARLEVLLVLAIIMFLLQAFPSLWKMLVSAIDVRAWSRAEWLGANIVMLVGLIGVRFRKEFKSMGRRSAQRNLPRSCASKGRGASNDIDYAARVQRDAEWRERAKKRLPFT